jgi:hypothetical protein
LNLPPVVAVLNSSVLVSRRSRIMLSDLADRPEPKFVPVWSEWIIAEAWRVLTWRWATVAGRLDVAEWHALSRIPRQRPTRLPA